MLSQPLDIASAAYQVGYESPSQFSREYSRQFGCSPLKDRARLRALAETVKPRFKPLAARPGGSGRGPVE